MVRHIGDELGRRGVRVWMDDRQFAPGARWIQELQEVIAVAPAAAVFLGKDGLGLWQTLEIEACIGLHLNPQRRMLIVPVSLPGLPDGDFPLFLKTLSWVDFSQGFTEAGLSQLARALKVREKSFDESPTQPPAGRVHNLPFLPLGSFLKGRGEDLQRLESHVLGPSESRPHTLAISGLGGIGKTRLAVEYAWRASHRYDATLFVVADSPRSLQSGLAGLARLGLPGLAPPAPGAQEEEVAAVLRWLQEHHRWLLILDNVDLAEAAEAVQKILPRLGDGQVLITSSRREWPVGIRKQSLAALPLAEAVEFLLQRTEGERAPAPQDHDLAVALAGILDGLPLALEQAAAYIVHHQMSFAAYLEEWEGEREAVLSWHDATVIHSAASLAVTWQTTFHQLSPTAAAILRLTAYLAPNPIPLNLFEDGKHVVEKSVKLLCKETRQSAKPRPVREAISELAAYSLITREAGSMSVHRIVQEVLRARAPEKYQIEWIEQALRLVADRCPPPGDVRTWPDWELLRPHAAVVTERAERAGIARPTAHLMSQLAYLLYAKSLYAEAEPLMRRALRLYEDCFGAEHPEVAVRLNNLASLLQRTNRLEEAETLMSRALKIDQGAFGANHPNVARDLHNLAQLLEVTGRFAEAEPLMRQAVKVWEESLGARHPSVAAALNNLAALLQATHRLAEAEPLIRRALEIDEESSGAEHPDVARDLSNLAELFKATNRLTEAEPLMRRALEIWESSLGPDHPDVAASLNNLAGLLQITQRLGDAEPLMRRALTICETRLGFDHPHSRTARENLASLLAAKKSGEARL